MNTFFFNGIWIHGAVVYGYAHRADSVDVRQSTDSLLALATQRIVNNLKEPRFIMGDFNQLHGQLEQPNLWVQMGWQEVQLLHEKRTGDPVQATCKQTTTKDFIYLSPELAQFFRKVELVNHVFSDHAALCAHFHMFGTSQHIYNWRMPKVLPWNECNADIRSKSFQLPPAVSPDEACKVIANEFEQRVHATLISLNKPGLLPCHRGRCCTMSTQKLQAHSKPLKPSRHGELVPQFLGQNLQHHRQFTQLRRLESLRRLYNVPAWNEKQATHAYREWRAVLRAPGFGHFPTWWRALPEKFAGAPSTITAELPTGEELSGICLVVDREVRRFEKVLQAEQFARAQQCRAADPNKIFKDFAKNKAAPVTVLQDASEVQIVEVDHDQSAVVLDKPQDFGPGEIVSPAGHVTPICMCEDMIWLDSVQNMAPGQTLRQEHFVGQIEELFARFAPEWQARWDRHKDIPEATWEPLWPDLTKTWQRLCSQLDYLRTVRKALHDMLLAIGVECLLQQSKPHDNMGSLPKQHAVGHDRLALANRLASGSPSICHT